ncbi:MAG: cation:proton antiporter, partial [Betaproteobacteria bacterium]
MPNLSFLPNFPPALSNLALTGLILLAGLGCGELFRRVLFLPRISGYVAAGLLLGPGTFGLVDKDMLQDSWIVLDIALGLILFELGSRLDLTWFKRNRWLLASSVAECVLSFLAIFVVLLLLGAPKLQAGIGAAIGTATGAPVLLLIIHSERSDGLLTDRAINLTALNNVFAVVALTMLLAFLHLEYRAGVYLVFLHPLYLLLGSALLGLVASVLLVWLARWVGKREDLQFILLVAMVLLTVGMAKTLHLSNFISLLVLGVMARNRDAKRDLLPV